MSNKKEILIGWIKSFISVLPAFALFFSFMTVFALHTVIAINFLMIIFDLLFVTAIIISENLFKFPRNPRTETYAVCIDIVLFFLALIIGALHWDAVKLIWQRYFG